MERPDGGRTRHWSAVAMDPDEHELRARVPYSSRMRRPFDVLDHRSTPDDDHDREEVEHSAGVEGIGDDRGSVLLRESVLVRDRGNRPGVDDHVHVLDGGRQSRRGRRGRARGRFLSVRPTEGSGSGSPCPCPSAPAEVSATLRGDLLELRRALDADERSLLVAVPDELEIDSARSGKAPAWAGKATA